MRPDRSRTQDSGRFGLAYWMTIDAKAARMVDARAIAAAELELLIVAHQPDDAGDCGACKEGGSVMTYPCQTRLMCEQAAVALQRRRRRAGGTAFEGRQ